MTDLKVEQSTYNVVWKNLLAGGKVFIILQLLILIENYISFLKGTFSGIV